MSANNNADFQSPADRKHDSVHEESHITAKGVANSSLFDAVSSTEEEARVSPPCPCGSSETTIHDDAKVPVPVKLEKEDDRVEDACEGVAAHHHAAGGNDESVNEVDLVVPRVEKQKIESTVGDYDAILFEFDRFAYKGGGETVGFGYELGDLVWGKVKSHPWWPGQIFNELFASPSVRRRKREGEGHVLVAFFGDNSYGWFDPEELAPFEASFLEKSRQSSSRSFLKAVEEAIDELSRRKSLGLACRCRNEFNFWPFSVAGYYTVSAGDYEPGVYSLSQINRAREDFRPREMLTFVRQLGLTPLTGDTRSLEFVKNKATILAWRKALYEEFDDTYAQVFGSVPERPPRPTAPLAVDPSGASLSGPLVFAEALGKGKLSTTANQKKDDSLFKSRDEPANLDLENTAAQVVRPPPVDASGLSGKQIDSTIIQQRGNKKAKAIKKQGVETSALGEKTKKRKRETSSRMPPITWVKKKRTKVIRNGVSGNNVTLMQFLKSSIEKAEQAPGMFLATPASASYNQTDNQHKCDDISSSSWSPMAGRQNDFITLLVRDLRAIAINPLNGLERGSSTITRGAFLKYRSLVYQKSSVLSPPAQKEAHLAAFSSSSTLVNPAHENSEKSTATTVGPAARHDIRPFGSGKKRIQSHHPASSKKKKLVDSETDNKKKPMNDSKNPMNDSKKPMNDSKKPMNDSKNPMNDSKKPMNDSKKPTNDSKKPVQTKPMNDSNKAPPLKSAVPQRREAKEILPKNGHPKLQKALKPDTARIDKPAKVRRRTAMIMRFPKGAALPSAAELAAKFARFGPLEYSSTRVFWQTGTCRLVFQHKVDAEAALKFAASSDNLFGYENVFCFCHLKDAASEGSEPETVKLRKDAAASTKSSSYKDIAGAVQLKSCLKKHPNEEAGTGNGNSSGRDTRVKFVLGDGGPDVEQNCVTTTRHPSCSMDFSANLNPQPVAVGGRVTQLQNPKFPPHTPADISRELLSLLNRCRDVVNSVSAVLGYVPYHSL